jgi:ArsR family transcriptional regulator, arsenate/arsenite/antimonite-responsive transcriptional repressor
MKDLPVLPALCCGPDTPALDPAEAELLAARFKALADPARVTILNRLAAADEVCVCDFVAALHLSQPTVSHHLKVLRDTGLVESSRRGTWAYYRLVPEAVDALRGALSAAPAKPARPRMSA